MDDQIAPSTDRSAEREAPSWLEEEAEKNPEMTAPIEHLTLGRGLHSPLGYRQVVPATFDYRLPRVTVSVVPATRPRP